MFKTSRVRQKSLFLSCKTILISLALSFVFSNVSIAKDIMSIERKRTIVYAVQKSIESHYVETTLIASINSALSDFILSEQSAAIEDEAQFLLEFRALLKQFDPHFSVSHLPETTPNRIAKPSWFERLAQDNYGFTRVEKLDNNLGLIDFWGFADATEPAKQHVKEKLESLQGVKGLIIDLRNNGGGSAQMVQYISSFFLSGKVHLNSFYSRLNEQTQDFHTSELIEYPAFNQIPIVILISNKTFSAAEEFAYNFKHLNRAVIIGEPSKGGANPWQYFTLPLLDKTKAGIRVAIPTAKAVNPITRQNWEGTGVQPHQKVETENAEEIARSMLLRKMRW